jgi:hypothetical protein
VTPGGDVVCVAKNAAVLEGLLCVFHAERSTGGGLSNAQNDLPLLSDWDKHCVQARLAMGRGFRDRRWYLSRAHPDAS